MARTADPGMRVAALQMCSGADIDANLETADRLLAEAHEAGAALALLPENFAFMGAADRDKLGVAESEGSGRIQSFLAGAAMRHDLWVIAGSVPLRSARPDRAFGASLVYDPAGRLCARYRKIHLFDVDVPGRRESYRESATTARGNTAVSVPTPIGRIGLTICYDVRFPELYRRLVDEGATILTVPAAFTEATGMAHWHVLLRARAIENLAYVVAAAQHGAHPDGRRTYGHTLIVDPWGRIVAEKDAGDGIVLADVDAATVADLRRQFPVLQHRRMQ